MSESPKDQYHGFINLVDDPNDPSSSGVPSFKAIRVVQTGDTFKVFELTGHTLIIRFKVDRDNEIKYYKVVGFGITEEEKKEKLVIPYNPKRIYSDTQNCDPAFPMVVEPLSDEEIKSLTIAQLRYMMQDFSSLLATCEKDIEDDYYVSYFDVLRPSQC